MRTYFRNKLLIPLFFSTSFALVAALLQGGCSIEEQPLFLKKIKETVPVSIERQPPVPSSNPSIKQYSNPLSPEDFPDPFILFDNGKIYAYASYTSGYNIPVMVSNDDWMDFWFEGDSMPEPPSWSPMTVTWAPAVIKINDKFIMYVSTGNRTVNNMCTSIAISDNPLGPFQEALGSPLLCRSDCGQIDASPFKNSDGGLYLYWQADGDGCPLKGWILASELSQNGLSLQGKTYKLIHNDQIWEGPRIEAPSMLLHNGKYYLLFSGNDWWTDRYAVGYAICDTPTGPCIKGQENPILRKTDSVGGPGGQEWFTDNSGNNWIVYHGWTPPDVGNDRGGKRSIRIDPVRFVNNHPVIEGPSVKLMDQPQ